MGYKFVEATVAEVRNIPIGNVVFVCMRSAGNDVYVPVRSINFEANGTATLEIVGPIGGNILHLAVSADGRSPILKDHRLFLRCVDDTDTTTKQEDEPDKPAPANIMNITRGFCR